MRFAPAAALTATILVVAILIAACPRPAVLVAQGTPASGLPGCGKDTDCKGSRVCERGQCVEPHGGQGGAGSSSGSGAAAMQQSDGGARLSLAGAPDGGDGGMAPPITLPGASPALHGGWSHNGRSRFRVSQQTPRNLGQLPTGGTVVSSPAITDDGLAIFGSHDKSVYAVTLGGERPTTRWSRATGDLVWCAPALGPGGAMPPASPGAAMAAPPIKSAPRDGGVAPDGGVGSASAGGSPVVPVVYVGSDDDRLYALESVSGAVRWSFVAGPCKRAIGFGPEAARCDVDGVTVGPDGTIYLVADGAYALRPDGTLKWRFALRTHCAAAPAVGPDGNVYFGCQDGRLYAVGPDGNKRWEFPTRDDIDSPPAVGADGTIYVGSDDSRLYAISPTGVLRWALKTGGDVRGGPAIAEDGTIYAGSFDGNLYAVHPDGTVAWSFATADRILSSPTIDAAGVVLVGSQDDRLYAVAPDGKLLWSVLLGGDVDGTPAIGPGGIIVVGSDDKALHVFR